MARRLTTALTGFGAFAASVLLLAGCASQAPAGGDTDDDRDDVVELEVDATWLAGGSVIGLVTQGSSTCVPTADEPTYQNGLLTVTLTDPSDGPCTRDLVPRVSLITVPEGVDPSKPLEIEVTYGDAIGDTDLDGLADAGTPEEGAPSAAWIGDNQLALLTWGSGSTACFPVAESAVAEGGVVTVTIAEPAADQVCTSDYRAQGTVVFVEGAVDDEAYELVLTGFGFDNVSVPVIGTP